MLSPINPCTPYMALAYFSENYFNYLWTLISSLCMCIDRTYTGVFSQVHLNQSQIHELVDHFLHSLCILIVSCTPSWMVMTNSHGDDQLDPIIASLIPMLVVALAALPCSTYSYLVHLSRTPDPFNDPWNLAPTTMQAELGLWSQYAWLQELVADKQIECPRQWLPCIRLHPSADVFNCLFPSTAPSDACQCPSHISCLASPDAGRPSLLQGDTSGTREISVCWAFEMEQSGGEPRQRSELSRHKELG